MAAHEYDTYNSTCQGRAAHGMPKCGLHSSKTADNWQLPYWAGMNAPGRQAPWHALRVLSSGCCHHWAHLSKHDPVPQKATWQQVSFSLKTCCNSA